jgi:hypothetical protein
MPKSSKKMQRPFKCQYCSRNFAMTWALENHLHGCVKNPNNLIGANPEDFK